MQIVRGSNSKYGKDVAQRISESVPRTAQLQALFRYLPQWGPPRRDISAWIIAGRSWSIP
jgi:hypothetical protein